MNKYKIFVRLERVNDSDHDYETIGDESCAGVFDTEDEADIFLREIKIAYEKLTQAWAI